MIFNHCGHIKDVPDSPYQLIGTVKGEVLIRHYDEEKDCFCKLFTAKKCCIVERCILFADGNLYLSYNGKNIFVGKVEDGQCELLLKSERVLRFAVPDVPELSLFALFVEENAIVAAAVASSYSHREGKLDLVCPNGENVCFNGTGVRISCWKFVSVD